MIAVLGCVLAAAAAAALTAAPDLLRPGPPFARSRRSSRPRPVRHLTSGLTRICCLLAGTALAAAGLGAAGLLIGAALAAVLPGAIARAEPAEVGRVRREVIAALPLAADLLAAALTAGADPATALDQTGRAVSGRLGVRFVQTATALRLGADPAAAWADAVAAGGESLSPLAEAFDAARMDGSALADRLARLATEAREVATAASVAAAQRAGIRAVAPLGLCFLPAFVAVGVVPVIAAALGHVRW